MVPSFFCLCSLYRNTENFVSFGPLRQQQDQHIWGGEGVKNSLKIWGAASLVLRVDLPFHLLVLRGSICVVDWRKFTDRGGKLEASSQPRVCLHVLLTRD